MGGETKKAADRAHKQRNCRDYLGDLSEYVDGVLSDELCREIEAHMAECENCRVVVNTLTKTVTLYHQLPEPEMPHAVRERLFKVLNLDEGEQSVGQGES
ncbi:MAG: zf-HC2 domain-containing protein [Anaerolineae bacterium]|nr:zf-HC2 domain-containing protein [Anaerolineae bacterium]